MRVPSDADNQKYFNTISSVTQLDGHGTETIDSNIDGRYILCGRILVYIY